MSQPLQFLVLTFACWLNRQQEDLIEYLREENRVLREQLGRPLQLNDDQRRRLARRGRVLGRRALDRVATLVTPDTILRWYRELIARKYDGSHKRKRGRPRTREQLADLLVRMARENPRWGYTRNHQGMENRLLERPPPALAVSGEVRNRTRLGGLLSYYHREAA